MATLYFLKFLEPFCGATNTPVLDFWWFSSGFQGLSGQPYSHLAEAYVLHIPWDTPLVWHLPTSWRPVWQPSPLFHVPVRHWWDSKLGAIMPPIRQTLYSLSYSGSAMAKFTYKISKLPAKNKEIDVDVRSLVDHGWNTYKIWRLYLWDGGHDSSPHVMQTSSTTEIPGL